MQRNGKAVVVHAPQILEQHLGLAAGVDENQRGLVALDQIVDLAERVARRMAGPGQPLLCVEHLDNRRRAAGGHDEVGGDVLPSRLRHQEARQQFRLGDGRRQADGADLGRQPKQPREAERQQIAALGRDQRMQFVEHDALQRAEQERRIVGGQQQRQLLRRGEQDVRRIAPLPLPPRHRRIAGAGLDLDRQPHLGDRRFEVARDVDGERLQRRDIEGVQAAGALDAAAGGDDALAICRQWRGKLHQRRQKSRQRLAGAGGRDQERRAAVTRLRQQRQLMLARRPAARGEPFLKTVRQQRSRRRGRVGKEIGRRHAQEVSGSGGFVEGGMKRAGASPSFRARRARPGTSNPGSICACRNDDHLLVITAFLVATTTRPGAGHCPRCGRTDCRDGRV